MTSVAAVTAAVTWDEALRESVLHLQATRAKKAARYYAVRLAQLSRWADENGVPADGSGKRHLDRYVAARREAGRARMTLRHGGVTAASPPRRSSPGAPGKT